jgi:hypothetical protein
MKITEKRPSLSVKVQTVNFHKNRGMQTTSFPLYAQRHRMQVGSWRYFLGKTMSNLHYRQAKGHSAVGVVFVAVYKLMWIVATDTRRLYCCTCL